MKMCSRTNLAWLPDLGNSHNLHKSKMAVMNVMKNQLFNLLSQNGVQFVYIVFFGMQNLFLMLFLQFNAPLQTYLR